MQWLTPSFLFIDSYEVPSVDIFSLLCLPLYDISEISTDHRHALLHTRRASDSSSWCWSFACMTENLLITVLEISLTVLLAECEVAVGRELNRSNAWLCSGLALPLATAANAAGASVKHTNVYITNIALFILFTVQNGTSYTSCHFVHLVIFFF